jgi:hypothetical protein
MNANVFPADARNPAYLTVEHTTEESFYAAPEWRLLGSCVERYQIEGRMSPLAIITLVYLRR